MPSLLFWIFAHSELTITERYRHGFDVFPDTNRTVPFGAGATLAYNHIDLQVKNETQNDFQIKLWLDKTHLNGELFSSVINESVYSIEERDHESLKNVTPAEVYFGTAERKLRKRKQTKNRTLKARKKQYQNFKLN